MIKLYQKYFKLREKFEDKGYEEYFKLFVHKPEYVPLDIDRIVTIDGLPTLPLPNIAEDFYLKEYDYWNTWIDYKNYK